MSGWNPSNSRKSTNNVLWLDQIAKRHWCYTSPVGMFWKKKKKQQQFDGMEWDKRWSQRCCSVHRGTEHGAAWAAAHFMNVRIETLMSRRQEDR